MSFAKLPVLSVHPECVDYVPLHTLKEHPLWNVLNNDEYFRGPNLFSTKKKLKDNFFKLIANFLLIKTKKSFRRQLF